MFFPAVAVVITFIGAAGLVLSSLVRVGDFVFNASAVCLVAGPLVFFTYVVIGLYLEFVSTGQKPQAPISRSRPLQAAASSVAFDEWTPEGLKRDRLGPLNRRSGRAKRV